MADKGQITIELAREKDCIELSEMSRVAIEYGLRWRWKPSRILALIRDPDACVIVARTSDGQIAGFAAMVFYDAHGHLNLLASASQFRRQGIGGALLQWLEISARIAGLGYINLEVRESNGSAIQFYEGAGYQIQVVKHGYYDGKEDAVRMSRQLVSAEFAARRP